MSGSQAAAFQCFVPRKKFSIPRPISTFCTTNCSGRSYPLHFVCCSHEQKTDQSSHTCRSWPPTIPSSWFREITGPFWENRYEMRNAGPASKIALRTCHQHQCVTFNMAHHPTAPCPAAAIVVRITSSRRRKTRTIFGPPRTLPCATQRSVWPAAREGSSRYGSWECGLKSEG